MNSNSKEFWKDKATVYKRELDDLIREKLARKNEEVKAQEEIRELKKLVEEYKHRLSKEKQPKATLGQKMVLLDYFGIIDFINQLKLDQTCKYKLLAYIVDAHENSVAGDFNQTGWEWTSDLNNNSNNKFLEKVSEELKIMYIKKWVKKADKIN